MGTIDHKEVTEAGAVVGATTRPEATMSVTNVEDRDTGLETVRMVRHRNSQRHLRLRQ